MLKELLKQLYSKLESEFENDRKNKTGNFDFFEERVLKEERFKKYPNVSVTSKTMKNYYEKHVEGRKNKSKEPTTDLKNLIAEYLDYKNYADFVLSNTSSELPKRKTKATDLSPKKWYQKYFNEIAISSAVLFISLFSFFIYKNNYAVNHNCIVWNGKYYEESSCLVENSINNSNHAINITVFKKVTVTKNTTFFKNGRAIIWYGKNKEGKREFFSDRGFHPETLKELKPITRTILDREQLLEE